MRLFRWLCIFVLFAFRLSLFAQTTGNQITKDSSANSIFINEVYLYDSEHDKFNYKKKKQIGEWIEIYNGTQTDVRTRQFYFTDDLNDPLKWNIRVGRRKYRILKKNGFVPVYINNSRNRNGAITDYTSDENLLYLIWKKDNTIILVDSIKLSEKNRYPYSRYPDGEKFTTTNALTPGFANGNFKETDSRRIIGMNIQIGKSTTSSAAFKNNTQPAIAGSFGAFYIKTFPKLSMEFGFRYGIRGFEISYDTSYTTGKGTREIHTRGKQTTQHLDLSYYLSNYIVRNISLYYGPVFSIRTRSILKYDQNIDFTFSDTGRKTNSATSYKSHAYNTALDIIDLSFTVGLRYHFKDLFNLSICYNRDFAGINTTSFTGNGRQTSSGYYLVTEIPLKRTMTRVKNTLWLKKIKSTIF